MRSAGWRCDGDAAGARICYSRWEAFPPRGDGNDPGLAGLEKEAAMARDLGQCDMAWCENDARLQCQYCLRYVCDADARRIEGIVCAECASKGF